MKLYFKQLFYFIMTKIVLHKNILFFCLLIVFFLACNKPKGFDFKETKNITITNIGFNKTLISLDMVYYNPNDFGVDLRNVDCEIYVDKNFLGKYKLDTLMHIARKSDFVLPSKMEVDMKNIFKNALSALFEKEVIIDIKGKTKVGKAGIFVTVPVNYSTPYRFKLF